MHWNTKKCEHPSVHLHIKATQIKRTKTRDNSEYLLVIILDDCLKAELSMTDWDFL